MPNTELQKIKNLEASVESEIQQRLLANKNAQPATEIWRRSSKIQILYHARKAFRVEEDLEAKEYLEYFRKLVREGAPREVIVCAEISHLISDKKEVKNEEIVHMLEKTCAEWHTDKDHVLFFCGSRVIV